MKTVFAITAAATLLLGGSTESQAETKVVLKDMHICCGKCVKGIENAVKDLKDVKVTVNKDDETTTIAGDNDKAIQKAIDAIAAAGYHATSDHKKLKPKDDSGAKKGKVKRLELTGVHNCCGGCNVAVKKAIKTVDGVEADTAKANKDSFVVEGNFDALALIKALNKSGFHVKVKK
jgi:mercuric ion binding protein